MPFIDIHGKKVHVDGNSRSAQVAVDYLKKNPDNARAFFDETHKDNKNNLAHFEIPKNPEHKDITHHFTIVHTGDGKYNLTKRHGY